MAEAREKAASLPESKNPVSLIYAGFVIVLWIVVLIAIFRAARELIQG